MEEKRIKELVSKMTLEEKAFLRSGLDLWCTGGGLNVWKFPLSCFQTGCTG